MQAGWCLICGSTDRQEFARKAADRVAVRLAGDRQAALRFVICRRCGHVYQDPMLDDGDLARLYDDGYRPFFGDEEEMERERQRGRRFCEELAPLVETLTPGRRVLDIGCGSGSFLLAFQERGWEVFGIDPVPSWTEHVRRVTGGTEQTIVTGCYDADSFPGRTFSLILFSHTIEHLPDPAPLLQAMRRHLDEDGLLFVATPNLVNPPAADGLFKGFLAGAHVRLYSPGALRTVLARSGLRTRTELHYRPAFGFGLLAQLPRGRLQAATEGPLDDAAAIRDLFLAVQRKEESGPFGRNLAALLASQPHTLPSLCRKAETHDRLRLTHWGETVVAIAGITAGGEEVPLVSWEGPGEGSLEAAGGITPDAKTIVLLGLGSGAEARKLAGRLSPGQHLYIWETDPALAKAVLGVADLSELWASGRVTLLLGERPLQAVPAPPVSLYWTHAARRWNHSAYVRIAERLVMPSGAAAWSAASGAASKIGKEFLCST